MFICQHVSFVYVNKHLLFVRFHVNWFWKISNSVKIRLFFTIYFISLFIMILLQQIMYFLQEEAEENMDEWDEDKLAEVVAKKHGTEKSNATDIICKHFLEAVENNKYGWFWECPAGGKDCKYKHALPKGFVLKKDKKRMEKEREEISLEDLIEKERATLDHSKVTKVTLETFVAWKKKKLKEKKEAAEKLKVVLYILYQQRSFKMLTLDFLILSFSCQRKPKR